MTSHDRHRLRNSARRANPTASNTPSSDQEVVSSLTLPGQVAKVASLRNGWVLLPLPGVTEVDQVPYTEPYQRTVLNPAGLRPGDQCPVSLRESGGIDVEC